jgi:hypothetical protein
MRFRGSGVIVVFQLDESNLVGDDMNKQSTKKPMEKILEAIEQNKEYYMELRAKAPYKTPITKDSINYILNNPYEIAKENEYRFQTELSVYNHFNPIIAYSSWDSLWALKNLKTINEVDRFWFEGCNNILTAIYSNDKNQASAVINEMKV